MKKKFKAFTLVEMLIVMGIIIILMAVGITAGRYAINRANDVAHQNAVDNFYTAVQAYYADNRAFPDSSISDLTLSDMIDPTNEEEDYYIGEYMDQGAFDGGTQATYYYMTDDLQQEVLICVSLYGQSDGGQEGDFYCNGNSFGSTEIFSPTIADKVIPRGEELDESPQAETFDIQQDWDGDAWE